MRLKNIIKIYMIIVSTQLNDWGEQSANDCIALVEYFLED